MSKAILEIFEKMESLVLFFVIIIVTWLIVQIKNILFKKVWENRSDLKVRFTEQVTTVVIVAIGVLLAFSAFGGVGFMWKSLLGGTAFVSAVVVFMAQDVIKDILAALMISMYQPFEIGDRIELEDGTAGIVEDVTMRHTVLLVLNTVRIVIPNRRLADMKLRNFSYGLSCRSYEFTFEISYPSDVEYAMSLIKRAVMESEYSIPGRNTKNGMEYGLVYFMGFEASSLMLKTVVYYPATVSTELLVSDINTRVDHALWENGIEIPYTYVTVMSKDSEIKDRREALVPEPYWKTPMIDVKPEDADMIREAMDATTKLGEENNLSAKQVMRLRLLGEELLRLMPSLVGNVRVRYWAEHDKYIYSVHVSALVYMTREKERKLLSVSSTGKNAANQHFTDKMRFIIADILLDDKGPRDNAVVSEDDSIPDELQKNRFFWSMKNETRKAKMKGDEAGESGFAWGELEKSIISKIADDVSISIVGNKVEAIAYKKFE